MGARENDHTSDPVYLLFLVDLHHIVAAYRLLESPDAAPQGLSELRQLAGAGDNENDGEYYAQLGQTKTKHL